MSDPHTRRTGDGRLPGDLEPAEMVARMLRVNHAGEYGAVRIYAGQRAVLGQGRHGPVLAHMEAQEQEHLAYFSEALRTRRGRPTALLPLWHAMGFALGAGTALLGERAAMACTVAVEEAIDQHYAEQVETLGEDEAPLREKVEQFRAEELEHRDIGLANEAERAPAYPLLSAAIKTGSRLAIWLSSRV